MQHLSGWWGPLLPLALHAAVPFLSFFVSLDGMHYLGSLVHSLPIAACICLEPQLCMVPT